MVVPLLFACIHGGAPVGCGLPSRAIRVSPSSNGRWAAGRPPQVLGRQPSEHGTEDVDAGYQVGVVCPGPGG